MALEGTYTGNLINIPSYTPDTTPKVSSGITNGWSAGFNILGTVLGIGTSIYTASLQKKVADANATLAIAQGNYANSIQQYNVEVSRANQLAIRQAADFEIARVAKVAERFRSTQVAGYSKAGVKAGGGSPLTVMIDSAAQYKVDQALIDYKAKVGILQEGSKAEQYNSLGQLYKSNAQFKASQFQTEGKYRVGQSYADAFNQGTSLLSTVSGFSR